jgi:hypothetical protein
VFHAWEERIRLEVDTLPVMTVSSAKQDPFKLDLARKLNLTALFALLASTRPAWVWFQLSSAHPVDQVHIRPDPGQLCLQSAKCVAQALIKLVLACQVQLTVYSVSLAPSIVAMV